MRNSDTYSVSELSRVAGVSVRTLHYYDQVGLLVADRRVDNGYREYRQAHVIRLQQILIYRALDFGIEDILSLLDANSLDQLAALKRQKAILLERQKSTRCMINNIETTMETLKEKRNREILFDGIPKEKVEHWRTIAKEQSTEKGFERYLNWVGGLSEEEARYYNQEGNAFASEYRQVLNLPVDSKDVQELAARHYEMVNNSLSQLIDDFQGVSYEGFLTIAEQMVNDKLTREVYEEYQEGMSKHLSDAMIHFAEKELKSSEMKKDELSRAPDVKSGVLVQIKSDT